ncbi:MAG: NADH-quinone oxidoreductase subunit J [Candidatus Caldarchaeales archaeon]
MNGFLEIILIISIVCFSILTVEVKSLIHAVIFFALMCIMTGVLFWILGAYYVAVFQMLVYVGAMVVLFLAVIMLTHREERELK